MKRLFDILISFTALFLLWPFMLFIWLIVVVSSGFPGFFKQKRVGQNGIEFSLLKYRTMTTRKGTEKGSFDAGNASRVTPLGRCLRDWKLDEIPQLVNVLSGKMSIVGPRPEVRKWVEVYPERWKKVLAVKPGITDPASIVYRNEESILAEAKDPDKMYREEILPRKLDLYEKYLDQMSMKFDLTIILKTIVAVVKRGSK